MWQKCGHFISFKDNKFLSNLYSSLFLESIPINIPDCNSGIFPSFHIKTHGSMIDQNNPFPSELDFSHYKLSSLKKLEIILIFNSFIKGVNEKCYDCKRECKLYNISVKYTGKAFC